MGAMAIPPHNLEWVDTAASLGWVTRRQAREAVRRAFAMASMNSEDSDARRHLIELANLSAEDVRLIETGAPAPLQWWNLLRVLPLRMAGRRLARPAWILPDEAGGGFVLELRTGQSDLHRLDPEVTLRAEKPHWTHGQFRVTVTRPGPAGPVPGSYFSSSDWSRAEAEARFPDFLCRLEVATS
jgi:hypothetical protein